MKKVTKISKRIGKILVYTLAPIVIFSFVMIVTIRPSNNRNWNNDQKVMPSIEVTADNIRIDNIRDFVYASTTSYAERYYSATFPRGSVKRVWYAVEPFSMPGAAHTFLSFEFEDGRYLPISVEIRKEKGESFNPIKGLLRQYELMYVIGDERDIIKLRTNYRHDNVYLYPMRATKDQANTLFEDMIKRAISLQKNPEFYNTIWNNCTTNIVDHVNKITRGRIPMNSSQMFPANSDYYVYKLGLIDTDLPIDKIRDRFKINDLAKIYANSEDFSKKIRGL